MNVTNCKDMPHPVRHRFIETNNIRMHIAEQGEGPLVIFTHGFPESWYSWRHQMAALAEAGYHAVAPDQRGYGQTDAPERIDAYSLCHLSGDIVGLIYALNEGPCALIGHDWGAPVAWTTALLRPDLIHTLGLLSVPFIGTFYDGPVPTEGMQKMQGPDKYFYQYYFQEPGRAEKELEEDVRGNMLRFFYGASATTPVEKRWRLIFPKTQRMVDGIPVPTELPPWLTEEDLRYFASEFKRTGFRGGLNWYRNMDRNRELLAFLKGSKILQPTYFLAGEVDGVIVMYKNALDRLEENVPNLKGKVILPGAGHWVQQEKAEETNRHLLAFLKGNRS